MKPIIVKELRERRFSLIAYCLATIGFIVLYVSLYPQLHAQAETYSKLFSSFPKGFSDAFGFDTNFLSSIQTYLAGEFYSLTWQLLLIIFVISRAGSAIAGEIEKGTIAGLLSQPLSRTRLFFSKYLAGVYSLIIFIMASVLTVIPVAFLYRINFWTRNFLVLAMMGFLFGMAIYSFTIFLSAVSSEKSRVYGILGGLLFVMYVLNIVSGLKENLKNLQYASLFHYFNSSAILGHSHVGLLEVSVFGGMTIIFSLLGLYIFNKRDISV